MPDSSAIDWCFGTNFRFWLEVGSVLLGWVGLAGSKLGVLGLQDAKAFCEMFCHVGAHHRDHVIPHNLGKFCTGHFPVLPNCQIAWHVVGCCHGLKDLTEVDP